MSVVYTLKYPMQFGDRDVTELTFNRLKGKHLKKINLMAPSMTDMLDMASKSAGEPPALFDEMDAEDFVGALEVVGGFLGSSLKTGESA